MSGTVSSEQSAVSRPALPIWALRALIRNDEARIEHLTQWVNSMQPGDYAPALADMQHALDAAHAKIVEHSTALFALCGGTRANTGLAAASNGAGKQLSPAASSLANVAPSGDAVQPGSLTTS